MMLRAFNYLLLLLIVAETLSKVETNISSDTDYCDIKEINGFLKYSCLDKDSSGIGDNATRLGERHKCPFSNQSYYKYTIQIFQQLAGREFISSVNQLCENDPFFYQGCGLEPKEYELKFNLQLSTSSKDEYPCGYFCQRFRDINYTYIRDTNKPAAMTWATLGSLYLPCSPPQNCLNTEIDNEICNRSPDDKICDGVCDPSSYSRFYCQDEILCNGFRYGLWCSSRKRSKYVPPHQICNGQADCFDSSDESNCDAKTNLSSCKSSITGRIIPLFNYTRCQTPFTYENNYLSICEDYLEHTNCSDISKVGLTCLVRGFMTSVARHMICFEPSMYDTISLAPRICDDGLDQACHQLSSFCFVHKHVMCDGVPDCSDKSDESAEECLLLTTAPCQRKLVNSRREEIIPFPVAWIRDGVNDCAGGKDEDRLWPTCGLGETLRYRANNSQQCDEVFYCFSSTRKYIKFTELCDNKESCPRENEMCRISKMQGIDITFDSLSLRDEGLIVASALCWRGLEDILRLKNDHCYVSEFNRKKRQTIFGYNKTTDVIHPGKMVDCQYFYGETYVLLNHLERCRDSRNILKTPVTWKSCPRSLRGDRIFTTTRDGYLTFLLRDSRTDELSNDLFVCTNNDCVSYDKVCDLVNDCGDSSDETGCDNHFKCENVNELILITQKCDEVIHCSDKSDECNASCGQQIVNSLFLKVVGWVIGILAIILNSVTLRNTIPGLLECTSEITLINKSFIMLISIGDFMMGMYLILISSFDLHYGKSYCRNHYDWISSDACPSLGAVSTVASQLSLYSMTFLGFYRFFNIRRDFTTPRSVSKSSFKKLFAWSAAIIVPSISIAILPLIDRLEDVFVNGVRFVGPSTVLFQGCPGKKTLQNVLSSYFDARVTKVDLNWSTLERIIQTMFSQDYGGISIKKLSFYGNDPVCLFKYFARIEEPQGFFVFAITVFNFACFILIAISYVGILALAKRSDKDLRRMQGGSKKQFHTDAKRRTGMKRLERTTFFIIMTDFICWVPFLVICFLHSASVVDASPWYAFFSIMVLPINSVINPLLYDTFLRSLTLSLLAAAKKCLSSVARNILSFHTSKKLPQQARDLATPSHVEGGIEMMELRSRQPKNSPK